MLTVSVVIPVWNGERFVGQAIQSVLSQTYRPLEIIVVDDGSSDRTQDVVRHITSPVPLALYGQENQGPARARNFGVSQARGDWIAFLDADDEWFPEKLAEQVAYLESCPEAQFVYSDVRPTDERGEPATWRWSPVAEFAFLIFPNRHFALPSTVLIRKDLFLEAGGFPPALRLHEDMGLWARIVQLTPVHFITTQLATYRIHAGQTTRDPARQLSSMLALFQLLEDVWKDDPVKSAVLKRDQSGYAAPAYTYYLKAGAFSEARHYARLGFASQRSWKHLRRFAIACCPGVRGLYCRLRFGPLKP